MDALFLTLLNMCITASYLIIAVIILRLFLRKAPHSVHCVLWSMVAFRLIFPFSFRSDFSLIPSAETIPSDIGMAGRPEIFSGISALNGTVNSAISEYYPVDMGQSINPVQVWIAIAKIIWLCGIAVIFIYTAISYYRLHKKVSASIALGDNILICDDISTPFILGLFHPRIYLPSNLDETQMTCVTAHEKAHIEHFDHWWKVMAFALLTLYWFNPLIWIAYILFCRDLELACDERALKNMGFSQKKSYAETLLACSVSHRKITPCPLAFGEIDIKNRIKSALSYKKPGTKMIVSAVILCLICAGFFLTNPRLTPELDRAVSDAVLQTEFKSLEKGEYPFESHIIFATRKKASEITVYGMVFTQTYALIDNEIAPRSSAHIPTALTFTKKKDNTYALKEYWISGDGTYYEPSIREKFPLSAYLPAMRDQWYVERQIKNCDRKATDFFNEQHEKIVLTPYPTPPFMATYTENPDGTYRCHGHNYKYILKLKGSAGKFSRSWVYIVLSNDPDLTFEQVEYSMLSSNFDDRLDPETAVILDSWAQVEPRRWIASESGSS